MKRCTPEEAARLLRPEDSFAVPLGPGQPVELLRTLGERDDSPGLSVFAAMRVDGFPLFKRSGVSLRCGFFGPLESARAPTEIAHPEFREELRRAEP